MTLATWLIAGTLKGGLATLLVWGADRLASSHMRARSRRGWWLLIPITFLIPVHVTLPAGMSLSVPAFVQRDATHVFTTLAAPGPRLELSRASGPELVIPWLALLWLTGVIASLLAVLVPTWRAHRAWSRARLSTEPAFLTLLEDAKAIAGVTAPIGLVVSASISAPALLGWLRPRLLLPRSVADTATRPELKAIFLHELAHFKTLDIPTHWFFVLTRAVHWFNPLAYFAVMGWARYREEAADELAICWLNEPTAVTYGEVLLRTLGQCSGGAPPSGALAIGESINTLKRRMHMIRTYSSKSPRGWLAAAFALALAAGTGLLPAPAEEDAVAAAKKEATEAMQPWLTEIDAGDYAKSWDDASAGFQKAVTSERWVGMAQGVRMPLGQLVNREPSSAYYTTSIPVAGGKMLQGEFVVAQFKTSFENLKFAVETVTFEKDAGGAWKASGYLIKPGP